MQISNRLKSLAGLIVSTDKVADIGCDHALLDIYLIKNKIVDHVLVSDINNNALTNGIKNIKKYELEGQIETKLGSGIEVIDENINTVIISGMGANTIIKILSDSKINYLDKIIVQSNNDHYLLRRYMCLKGYYISHESVVYDKGKYYINIVFLKGTKKYSNKELRYGPILMYANKDYYYFLEKKHEQILDNIPKYKLLTRYKIRKDLIYLKKLTKK